MPLYDYECECGLIFEWFAKFDEEVKCPICWDKTARKIMPQGKSPSFKLTYNPKKDLVDWDGNRSQYWDEYKKQKSEGKKVRIPKEDGDG